MKVMSSMCLSEYSCNFGGNYGILETEENPISYIDKGIINDDISDLPFSTCVDLCCYQT